MTVPKLPRGIVPLLETPFRENGSIDYDSLNQTQHHRRSQWTDRATGGE